MASEWLPVAGSLSGGLLNAAAGFGSMALSQHYNKQLMERQNELHQSNMRLANDMQKDFITQQASLQKQGLINASMNPLLMQNPSSGAMVTDGAMPSGGSSSSSMSPFDSAALGQSLAQTQTLKAQSELLKAQKENVNMDTKSKKNEMNLDYARTQSDILYKKHSVILDQHELYDKLKNSLANREKVAQEVNMLKGGMVSKLFGTDPDFLQVLTVLGSFIYGPAVSAANLVRNFGSSAVNKKSVAAFVESMKKHGWYKNREVLKEKFNLWFG